jgi:hypothetical protein
MFKKITDLEAISKALATQYKTGKILGQRGGAGTDSKNISSAFMNTDLGKMFKSVKLFGERTPRNFVIAQDLINNNNVEFKKFEIENNNLDSIVDKLNSDVELRLSATQFIKSKVSYEQIEVLPEDSIDSFKKYARIYLTYGSELKAVAFYTKSIGDIKETVTRFTFFHKRSMWILELPVIDGNGQFMRNDSMYYAQLVPSNLQDYIEGKMPELQFEHPYEYLFRKTLEVGFEKEGTRPLIYQEFFDNIIARANGEIPAYLDKKINKHLTNLKEAGDDMEFTPIIYVDKKSSDVAKESLSQTVALNADYDLLEKYGKIKGLDLLSGSTSEPGRRVKTAINYHIVNDNGQMTLRRNDKNFGDLGDYISEYKATSPFFSCTSAKRDNTATIKDSYNLTNAQAYKKRVRLIAE